MLAVVLITAVLALIPARRLYVGGQPSSIVGVYFLAVWLLGIAAFEARGRLFVPLLLVLFVVPFITWREGLARLFGRSMIDRRESRPPPKNVTPGGDASTGPP